MSGAGAGPEAGDPENSLSALSAIRPEVFKNSLSAIYEGSYMLEIILAAVIAVLTIYGTVRILKG